MMTFHGDIMFFAHFYPCIWHFFVAYIQNQLTFLKFYIFWILPRCFVEVIKWSLIAIRNKLSQYVEYEKKNEVSLLLF